MARIAVLCVLIFCCKFAYLQQCQQITICGDNSPAPNNAQKGEVGAPGKAGSVGSPGSKGDRGDVGKKGEQGESCALGGFEEEIRSELAGNVI